VVGHRDADECRPGKVLSKEGTSWQQAERKLVVGGDQDPNKGQKIKKKVGI